MRSWARTLAGLAVVLAVIALAGGFGEAPQARRAAAVGEPVDNGHRVWTVRGAELTTTAAAGYTIEPVLRVRFRVVNTARISDGFVGRGVVELLMPDGTVVDDLNWRSYPRSLDFPPDIPADAFVEVPVQPPAVAGADLVVRIHHEVPADSVAGGESWRTTSAATDVTVRIRDAREAR